MKATLQGLFIGAAALVSTAALAPSAMAGCGPVLEKQPASWQAGPPASPQLTRISTAAPAIVGLWSFGEEVGGHTFDWGYQAWHSDGTEIMNSGSRAPASENFCMGVWAQTGPNSYSLNHFALSYDANGNLNAKVNIKAVVGVGGGGTFFDGPFTLFVYNPKTGALLQQVSGRIVGHRITVN